jgi:hypothetical protein
MESCSLLLSLDFPMLPIRHPQWMVKLGYLNYTLEMISTEFHQQCSSLTGFSDF